MSGRTYSEEEIGRVLKRVAEMQQRTRQRTGAGLTLEELRELAAEAGLDPHLVDAAAREIDAGAEPDDSNMWGGPFTVTYLRSVDGEISEETWEGMLAELRREFKTTGVTEERGLARQWGTEHHAGSERTAHLIATKKDGRTELEVFWTSPVIGVIYLTALLPSIIALPIIFEGIGMEGLAGFLVWLMCAIVFVLGARTLVSTVAGKARREVSALADRLEEIAATASSSPIATPVSRATVDHLPDNRTVKSNEPGPYMQLDIDEESEASDPQQRSRRRTR
jgi:hypothetical protein